MSGPYTRLRTEDEELMYDAGQIDGAERERKRIIALLQDLEKHGRFSGYIDSPIAELITLIERKSTSQFPQAQVEQVRQLLDTCIERDSK